MSDQEYYTYQERRGECQACGRTYRATHGKLIQHDYPENNHGDSRAWTFLTGPCAGAGKPPVELSNKLIARMIAKADKIRQRILSQQEKLRQPVTKSKAWKYEDQGRGRFEWVQVDVHMDQVKRRDEIARVFTYSIPGKPRPENDRIMFYPERPTSERQAAEILNRYYATWLQKQVDELDEYIQWQQEREQSWQTRELQAVKKYKKKRKEKE